jgi:hypothetical protein
MRRSVCSLASACSRRTAWVMDSCTNAFMSGSPHAFSMRRAETATETGDSGEAGSYDLDCFAIQHTDPSVIENFTNKFGLSRFEIVVTEDRQRRNSYGSTNIGREFLRFFGKSIISDVAAKQQDVSAARDLSKRFIHYSAGMFAVMKVCSCCDP